MRFCRSKHRFGRPDFTKELVSSQHCHIEADGIVPVGGDVMADEEEIILADLDDDELVQQMHDDLYDGLQDEIVEGVKILLDRKWTPYDVLTKALVEGMTIVGIDFRDDFVRARSVDGGERDESWHGHFAAALSETGAPRGFHAVIGTAKGDIHDIGKNLVS